MQCMHTNTYTHWQQECTNRFNDRRHTQLMMWWTTSCWLHQYKPLWLSIYIYIHTHIHTLPVWMVGMCYFIYRLIHSSSKHLTILLTVDQSLKITLSSHSLRGEVHHQIHFMLMCIITHTIILDHFPTLWSHFGKKCIVFLSFYTKLYLLLSISLAIIFSLFK